MNDTDSDETEQLSQLPQSGFRTTEYNNDQIKWRCQSSGCGHVTETRDTAHEWKCGQMVPVDPYTEVPIRYEHLSIFERIDLENRSANNSLQTATCQRGK
jgi:hypothetical protein